jgi:ribosome biogenesis GTPase A
MEVSMANINWFPGHMKKTLENIESTLKLIDLAMIVLDARAPLASLNPEILKLAANKERIIILNKIDQADDNITKQWVKYYEAKGAKVLTINSTKLNSAVLIKSIIASMQEKTARQLARGIISRPLRVAVMGIPNVGKSTLINALANKKAMRVENRPGVTRSLKWIKIANNIELLDTPGVLWPKLTDQEVAIKIAMLGGIKETNLPTEKLSYEILKYLTNNNLNKINKLYSVALTVLKDDQGAQDALEIIARKRGLILAGNRIKQQEAESLIIRDFQNGNFGHISLEVPQ